MPFFVLLLRPKFKKFELIQFSKTPENPSVQSILKQTSLSSSNPDFKHQKHIGFYCPKSEQEVILPEFSSTKKGDKEKKKKKKNDDKEDDSNPTEQSKKDAIKGEEKKEEETTNSDNVDVDVEDDQEQGDISNGDETKNIGENNEKRDDAGDSSSNDSDGNKSANDDDGDDSPTVPQSTSSDGTPTTPTKTKSESTGGEEIPLPEGFGPVLVAIPEGYSSKEIAGLSKTILSSPSFAILTTGSSILDPVEKTTTEQEIEQLNKQALTKHVGKHLQKKASTNQASSELYQQQEMDLEQRRKKRLESKKVPGASPDAHGLSPVDAMRVAQNQQRAAARQQERATLQQYQRHSLSSHSFEGTTNTVKKNKTQAESTKSSNEPATTTTAGTPDDVATTSTAATATSSTVTQDDNEGNATVDDDNEDKDLFVPPSSAKRESLERQKEAELEAIRKRRQEQQKDTDGGGAKTTKQQYFEPASPSQTRKAALAKQKEDELAALRGKGFAKTWGNGGSSHSLEPAAINNDKNKNSSNDGDDNKNPNGNNSNGNVVRSKPASFRLSHSNELDELRKQGLTNKSRAISLRAIPTSEEAKNSSTKSELEELRGLGLIKTVGNKYADSAMANEKKKEEYLAQQRDLEERKAKTTEFKVSRDAPLSAADEQALSLSKWKKEDRMKQQEALGYYREYKGERIPTEEEKAWKTTGKVHVSQGNEKSTKEWEAPDQAKEKAAKRPDIEAVKSSDTVTKPSEGAVEEMCSCACIIS